MPAPPSGAGWRGVPDVAGDADPETGYRVRVDGQDAVTGGASAVAPLWAGLIALFNQAVGQPAGYPNPLLDSLPAGSAAFHEITSGNNDGYPTGPGWDACTGLGSPSGAQLLTALTSKGGYGAAVQGPARGYDESAGGGSAPAPTGSASVMGPPGVHRKVSGGGA